MRVEDEGVGASGEGLRMRGRGCGGTAAHSKGNAHPPNVQPPSLLGNRFAAPFLHPTAAHATAQSEQ